MNPLLALLPFAVLSHNPDNQAPPGLDAEANAPFAWYLYPSDEIGFQDSPQAFQLTYDCALNNGFGELTLTADGLPLSNRIRLMEEGHLPVYRYHAKREDVRYDVQAFGAPSGLDPREDLVAYMRIRVTNTGKSRAKAQLRVAYGPRGASRRSDLHCRDWYLNRFNPHTATAASGSRTANGVVWNKAEVIYGYSGTPKTGLDNLGIQYDFDLAPGTAKTVDLKVPFVPIGEARKDFVAKFKASGFDTAHREVVRYWHDLFARATDIQVPDPKVVDTAKASLIYDLMARDVEADGLHFTQTVNKFQYHDFYMRDTSFIARSYELLNLPDIARTTVEHYLIRDSQGHVVRFRHDAPDDWGQSLWAVGQYVRTSGDLMFAKDLLPAVAPHLDDFEKAVRSDPLGLWPVAGPYDNELVTGHYTSHNLWALLGLREAEFLCRMAGDVRTAARARKLYVDFDGVFMKRLTEIAAKADGYIPPGMDDPNQGYDWENASGGVYPFHVLAPNDPLVTATLDMERKYKYREGIMTWGPNAWVGKQAVDQGKSFDPLYLHDYDTFQVTESLLARGEQQKVVEDLYSTLVHTSSTHAGFETGIRPWGDRDPGGNYPPHGWFAARYNELLRNMLVREQGRDLHLASALAPAWVEPGKTITVDRAPTDFGGIDMTISSGTDGAEVKIRSSWRRPPHALIFHVPWFVHVTAVSADGVPGSVLDGAVVLPASTKDLQLKWTWTEHPDLSYERAVKLWLHKAYQPGPGEDMNHLFPFEPSSTGK